MRTVFACDYLADPELRREIHGGLQTPTFHDLIGPAERRGLSPLLWTHINPYGRFRLDMNTRLDLTGGPGAATPTAG